MDISSYWKYKYYDTPEDEDLLKKMFCISKYATAVGLGIGTFDVLMYSYPKGYIQTLSRYAYFTGPLVGMATAFATANYMSLTLRKKDDALNYFIGGCAAGSIYGTWQKSAFKGSVACLVLGIAGALKKYSIEEGWEFFPEPKFRHKKFLFQNSQDWSLIKDVPKNWTTGKD